MTKFTPTVHVSAPLGSSDGVDVSHLNPEVLQVFSGDGRQLTVDTEKPSVVALKHEGYEDVA